MERFSQREKLCCNDQSRLQRFPCIVRNTNQGSFQVCLIKTHVQTPRESHDFNMDLCSFDNGFKQLCISNFMQEYRDHAFFASINICRGTEEAD